jgi:hypothetical protein
MVTINLIVEYGQMKREVIFSSMTIAPTTCLKSITSYSICIKNK